MSTLAKVMIIDDEKNLLNGLKRSLRGDYELFCAFSGAEAIRILEENGPFAATICDMRMPEMDGVATLQEIEKRSPETIRMMLTGNADQETASQAINCGHIFRFFSKPCSIEELQEGIEQALIQYRLVAGEKELLEQTLAGSVKVLTDVLGMVNPHWVVESAKTREWLVPVAKKLEIKNVWQLDLAAMLAPIGQITIPEEIAKKQLANENLSPVELEILAAAPGVTRDLIANIPRLTEVAEIVYLHQKNYDGSGYPEEVKAEKDIPISARLLKILIALARLTDGEAPTSNHFDELEVHAETWFDPKLLFVVKECLLGNVQDVPLGEDMEVKVTQLLPDDLLTEDLFSPNNQFLLAAGTKITRVHISQLHNINKLTSFQDRMKIHRLNGTDAASQKYGNAA